MENSYFMKRKRIRKSAIVWFVIQILIQIVYLLLVVFNKAPIVRDIHPLASDFDLQHILLIISGIIIVIGFILILMGRKLGFYIVSASLIIRWAPMFLFGLLFVINDILVYELLIILVNYLVLQIGGADSSWSRMI